MRTIQEQWEGYKSLVLPVNASPVQVSECRLAFYAGAQGMMTVFASLGEPDISDDAGVEIINGFQSELTSFLEEVSKQ